MKSFLFLIISFVVAQTAISQVQQTDPTKNAGKVEWNFNVDLKEIPKGVPATATFVFKNISTETLIIKKVSSGCGCTVPSYSDAPIPPGGTGEIKAIYDAKKAGPFYKVIGVETNFDEGNQVVLGLQGMVKE
jgi:hypothetical protein